MNPRTARERNATLVTIACPGRVRKRRATESRVRFGYTIGECLVAIAMLLPIAALVTKIGIQTENLSRESNRVQVAHRDLINARETIGTWDFDSISQSNIEAIPIPEYNAFQEFARSWKAVVVDETEPMIMKRITLSLQFARANSDNASEVGPLTFWVPKP